MHILAGYKQGSLPVPSYVGLTEAGMADLKAYEYILPVLQEQKINIFADKAYQVQDKAALRTGSLTLYTGQEEKGASICRCSRSTIFNCSFKNTSANRISF
ncbi:MAG: hypothetical protein RCG15_07085 [Candidatus Rickettsia vulgarisii]